jgi:hypothetical protein
LPVTFETAYISSVLWRSDSTLEIKSSSGRTLVQPRLAPTAPANSETCAAPATSSSAYCFEKGYITFNGSTRSIQFAAAPPAYLDWCE